MVERSSRHPDPTPAAAPPPRERRARAPELAFSAVLFGGASPAFRAAHSLDAAQVALDLPYCHELGTASADVLTTTGDATLTTSTGRCPLDPTFRIGSGKGHVFSIAPWEVRWSYSALDEARHDSALSLAFNLEAGWRSLGLGLSTSRTMVVGDVAVRPGIGVAFAHATRDYAFSVGADQQAAPDYVSPTELESEETGSTLTTRFGSNDILVPVGVDVPMRLANKLALVPFVGATAVVPLVKWVQTDSCDNCLLGLEEYDLSVGVQLWAGLRIEPWFVPQRDRPSTPPPPPASEASP